MASYCGPAFIVLIALLYTNFCFLCRSFLLSIRFISYKKSSCVGSCFFAIVNFAPYSLLLAILC
ncbi:CGP-CTERM sorting domain-containing protein [Priestia megaterium]|uniref:CGP-CTERM sorting domain-containing protein n=1 Tax=Priestia megaterium TaxID=1404 RepID=A0A6M6E894_PRIMG|nr:CGP-CTERM sorting domain-containing protein [Priestia megaterium NCT-2]MDR4233977.1 CGP-CTERM sorting domain-containing protein [Priestia megaterium]QCY28246.1 CGP-CTERM sorting domain-containing protein [Priestia megaterium NBRC 15308 = ATCC 14581]QJX79795.1 CGP-CTERM sorting domain-containing protein [Priestia megaterium]THJ39789.1 CGP-CTERM sorting domain-containing protein [Priestia megaterium]